MSCECKEKINPCGGCDPCIDPCCEDENIELGCAHTHSDECIVSSQDFACGSINISEGDSLDTILVQLGQAICDLETLEDDDTFAIEGFVTLEGDIIRINRNDGNGFDIDISSIVNSYEAGSGIEEDPIGTFNWNGEITENVSISGATYGITFSDVNDLVFESNDITRIKATNDLDLESDSTINLDSPKINLVKVPPTNNAVETVLVRNSISGEIQLRNISSIIPETENDGVVNAASLNGTLLTLSRTEGLPDVTVDLSSIASIDYIDNVTLNGNNLEFSRVGNAFSGTITLPTEEYHRITVTQPAHGFTLPTYGFIPVHKTAINWVLANTSDVASLQEGFIVEIIDTNTLVIQQSGFLEVTGHGLNVGQYYFLQDDGSIDTLPDPDIDDVLCFIVDNNNIQLIDNRPYIGNEEEDVIDYISNVELVGTDLIFTRVGNAFEGAIDLSSLFGGIIHTADNGLTLNVLEFELGGTLNRDTTIDGDNRDFDINIVGAANRTTVFEMFPTGDLTISKNDSSDNAYAKVAIEDEHNILIKTVNPTFAIGSPEAFDRKEVEIILSTDYAGSDPNEYLVIRAAGYDGIDKVEDYKISITHDSIESRISQIDSLGSIQRYGLIDINHDVDDVFIKIESNDLSTSNASHIQVSDTIIEFKINNDLGEEGQVMVNQSTGLGVNWEKKNRRRITNRGAGNYNIDILDDFIVVNTVTGGGDNYTLPDTATLDIGDAFTINDGVGIFNTNNLTVSTFGAELIAGAATYVMSVDHDTKTFVWNGNNYSVK